MLQNNYKLHNISEHKYSRFHQFKRNIHNKSDDNPLPPLSMMKLYKIFILPFHKILMCHFFRSMPTVLMRWILINSKITICINCIKKSAIIKIETNFEKLE